MRRYLKVGAVILIALFALLLTFGGAFAQNTQWTVQNRINPKMIKGDSSLTAPSHRFLYSLYNNKDSVGSIWHYSHMDKFLYKGTGGVNATLATESYVRNGQPVTSSATELYAFGDSYTVGVGATYANRAYINLFSRKFDLTLTNLAVSGMGFFTATKQARSSLPATNSDKLVTILCGFNDIRRGSGSIKTMRKLNHGIITILSQQFLKSATPASLCTKTGAWANFNTDTIGGLSTALGGQGTRTTGASDTLRTVINGTNAVIGTFAEDGVVKIAKSFEIRVDGVSKGIFSFNAGTDGINDGTYSNMYQPSNTIVYDIGASGNHTVDVISVAGTGELIIDYIGTLNPPTLCQPVLIGQTPRLTPANYQLDFTTYGYRTSDSTAQVADNTIAAAVYNNFSGYPVSIAPFNNYVVVSNDNIPADVHYNDFGHEHISNAFGSVLVKNNPFIIGNAAIGNANTGGFASFSHKAVLNSATGYALIQNSSGATFLNSASDLRLRTNNTDKIYIQNSSGFVGVGGANTNATVTVNGSISYPIRTVSATDGFGVTDYYILCNNTSPINMTLPAPTGLAGRTYSLMKINAAAASITINTVSGSINGSATQTVTSQYSARLFYTDGTNWFMQ